MGGPGMRIDARQAASVLRWWMETGVDAALQEQPRNWFEAATPPPPAAAGEPAPLAATPDTLAGFREWIASDPAAPLAGARSKAVRPSGEEGAEVMLLSDPPGRDEIAAGEPIGGEPGELMERMLAAIDLVGKAYSANLACFHSPAARLSPSQLEECAAAARRHVALARPQRLLLLGDAPSRALLGKSLVEARGHVHMVEGVRTIATFHPRQLLKRSSDKALAWKDLLLLMEDSQ